MGQTGVNISYLQLSLHENSLKQCKPTKMLPLTSYPYLIFQTNVGVMEQQLSFNDNWEGVSCFVNVRLSFHLSVSPYRHTFWTEGLGLGLEKN